MSRLFRVLVVAAVALGVAAPSAAAVPNLGGLWKQVLETPTVDNPLTGGDPCVDLGGAVAPPGSLSPLSPPIECTVTQGTKIFVTAFTSECSTLEVGTPFFGGNPRELRACARAVDAGITRTDVALDGRAVPVNEVESGLLRLNLPEGNIFDAPAGPGPLSVAHGWVAHLGQPLRPGEHEITIDIEGTYLGEPVDFTITTTIIVQPRG
jgi:hypothetical protein